MVRSGGNEIIHLDERRPRCLFALVLAFLVIAAALMVNPPSASAQVASFASAGGISIPDAGAGAPYPSAIVVSGLKGQVVRVTVTLAGLTHGRLEDVDILLVGPGGQSVLLLSDCCGAAAPVASVTLTFDDFGRRVAVGTPLTSGTIKPVNLDGHTDALPAPAPSGPYGARLSVFNGTDPNGTWRLFVHDDEASHGGHLADGWTLTIHTRTLAGTGELTLVAAH